AFLFENVVDSKGRRFDIPVAVGILASNREIYSVGIGCKVEDIKAKWDQAEQHPLKPEPVANPPCQEVVIEGAALNEPGRASTRCRFRSRRRVSTTHLTRRAR